MELLREKHAQAQNELTKRNAELEDLEKSGRSGNEEHIKEKAVLEQQVDALKKELEELKASSEAALMEESERGSKALEELKVRS